MSTGAPFYRQESEKVVFCEIWQGLQNNSAGLQDFLGLELIFAGLAGLQAWELIFAGLAGLRTWKLILRALPGCGLRDCRL